MENNLFKTNVDVTPVGVAYNITGRDVETFLEQYLTSINNIDGVAAVKCASLKAGSVRPEVGVYVFLNPNSKAILSSNGNIPERLRRKMDASYRASETLKKVLSTITRDVQLGYHAQTRNLYVKCDIFRVLGLMLAATPREHTITIPEVVQQKRNCIISVIKSSKFTDATGNKGGDKYDNIINDIES